MSMYLSIAAADLLRYLIPAGLTWLLLTHVFVRWARPRRLGPVAPGRQIRREILFSVLTALIFALNGVAIVLLRDYGIFEIYRAPGKYGMAYLVASPLVLVVAHDIYFYAIHRLLHRRWWFSRVHRWHHQSVNPSPWAAYAFHPVEAGLMALFLPLALSVLPIHGTVIFGFLLLMILRNVIGHCGVELATSGFLGRWYVRWFATTTHHHQHHRFGNGNYGLYLRFMDRLFGTERADYPAEIARLASTPTTQPGAKASV